MKRKSSAENAQRAGSLSAVLSNTGWLAGSRGLAAALSLVYLAIVTRTLGPAGFGQFALVIGIAQAVVALVGFQTWQIIVRFGMGHLKDAAPAPLVRLFKFCLALDLAGGLIGAALAALAIRLLAPSFGWPPNLAWLAFGFSIVSLVAVKSTPTGILRLYDRFGSAAAADSAVSIARLIGALIAWAWAPTISAFVIAWAVAEIASAAVHWFAALRTVRGLPWSDTRGDVRRTLRENSGLPSFAGVTNAGLSFALAGKQLPVLIIGFFATPAAAGAFRLAQQLAGALAKLSRLLGRSLFPELVRARTFAAHASEFRTLLMQSLRLSLIAGLVVLALLVFAGKPLLLLVAGPEFAAAYPLLMLLGVAAVVDLIGVGFEPALFAADRAGQAFRIRFVVTVLMIGAVLAAASDWGAIGVAALILAASVLNFLLMALAARRAFAAASGESASLGVSRPPSSH